MIKLNAKGRRLFNRFVFGPSGNYIGAYSLTVPMVVSLHKRGYRTHSQPF